MSDPLAGTADEALARPLLGGIARAAEGIGPVTLMEVCGTHTMAIARHGIRGLLPDNVKLVSGPGCPVCVTPVGYLDHACALALRPDTVVATFGDMIRVPGSHTSLARVMAEGARVKVVTSPLDALANARANPSEQWIFLAVGFETTTPTVAATIATAAAEDVPNFSVLCAHKTIPEALSRLVNQPDFAVHGLIAPGHVSAVIGLEPYRALAQAGVPCVVSGFEAAEVLLGIWRLLQQRRRGEARVENAYATVVRDEGNPRARQLTERVFRPCDAVWRGLGPLPQSGLELRDELARFDAAQRFEVALEPPLEPAGCICGNVLCGTAQPDDCPLFGQTCTPDDPVGACMVSSEGTCAAAYRYGMVS